MKPLFTGFIYFYNGNCSIVIQVSTHKQGVTQAATFYNMAKRFLLRWKLNIVTDNFYCCTVHSEIHIVHSPTNALFIKLGKV
jgi:hypothetical protein